MSEKKKCQAVVTSQVEEADGIFSMWLKFPKDYNVADMAVSGQFISLYCHDGSRMLPRPISICEINGRDRLLRVVYRIAGQGTREFSTLSPGDTVEVLGPLGNGFSQKKGTALVIGGGIGIPPMLQLTKDLAAKGQKVQVVLGYRDSGMFLKKEFEPHGDVYVSTEDGSAGTKGNVIDAIGENGLEADTIYACGPAPMLRGVQAYAREHGIESQLSMEERMACGIGACLACVCRTKETDSHSHVKNARVCKDGPVFYGEDIEL